jgi:putative ABC transport system permease protein
MTFFSLIAKNLMRRPARSALTVSGIAIGIAAVVALTSLARGFERSWTEVYSARGTDLIVARAGSLNPIAPPFPESAIQALRAAPGVARTSALLTDVVPVDGSPIALAFGLESGTFIWDHLHLVKGRWPASDDEPVVVLGAAAAEVLKKDLGSHVQVGVAGLTVCGIFESIAPMEAGAVVMTLPQLQQATNQRGLINFLNIRATAGAREEQIAVLQRELRARAPGFDVFAADEVAQHNSAIRAAKGMSWAVSIVALLVGAIGVMNTMLMSVFERTQEIGVLLAVGWRRRRIVRMILIEAVLLSAAGGAAGAATGALLVMLLRETPLLRGRVETDLGAGLFGIALAIALGVGLLGGLYPASRASRMRPADALRHE